MPGKKKADKDGKRYAWSDEGIALAKLGSDVVGAFSDAASLGVPEGRRDNINIRYYQNQATPLGGGKGDYAAERLHGYEGGGYLYAEDRSVFFLGYFNEQQLAPQRQVLEEIKGEWEQLAGKYSAPGQEKLKRLCEDNAFLAGADARDYAEAISRRPGLYGMVGLYAGAPKYSKYSEEQLREAMGSVYDDYMDLLASGTEELRVEFHRQKLAEDGWNDDKEAIYKAELKAAHEKAIEAFDKLDALEDPGQYDEYLNNGIDHALGKDPAHDRDVRGKTGYARGELQAINNGWPANGMQLLGFYGMMKAQLEKHVIQRERAIAAQEERLSKARDIEDEAERKREVDIYTKELDKLNKELSDIRMAQRDMKKNLEPKVWERKVEDPRDVACMSVEIADFMEKYKDLRTINDVLKTHKEIIEEVMEPVQNLKQREEEEFYAPLKALEEAGDYRAMVEQLTDFHDKIDSLHPWELAVRQKAISRLVEEFTAVDETGRVKNEEKLKKLAESLGEYMAELRAGGEAGIRLADAATQLSGRFLGVFTEKDKVADGRGADIWFTAQQAVSYQAAAVSAEAKNAKTDAELKALDEKNVLEVGGITAYKLELDNLSEMAMEKLALLDSRKKGKADTAVYTAMRNALVDVTKLGPHNNSEQVEDALRRLKDTAAEYERTYDSVWHLSLGRHRLRLSKEIKHMAEQKMEQLREKSEALVDSMATIDEMIDGKRKVFAGIDREKNARRVNVDELRKEENQSANKAGKRPEPVKQKDNEKVKTAAVNSVPKKK